MKLNRVSKKEPCPICQKSTWCLLGPTSALCMRVSSNKPYTLKGGEQGYWHKLDGVEREEWKPKPSAPRPVIDAEKLMREFDKETESGYIENMAREIGISFTAAVDMYAAYASPYRAWAWPMRDGFGKMVGIRLRSNSGQKWAVTGSRQGIFLPFVAPQKRAYIVEGPTDAAAMLTIGSYAIGRPSCSGGVIEIKQSIHRLGIQEVVVVADNDNDRKTPQGARFNPGIDGARALMNHIFVKSCMITLPAKDIREFVKQGGNSELLESITRGAVWQNLKHSS